MLFDETAEITPNPPTPPSTLPFSFDLNLFDTPQSQQYQHNQMELEQPASSAFLSGFHPSWQYPIMTSTDAPISAGTMYTNNYTNQDLFSQSLFNNINNNTEFLKTSFGDLQAFYNLNIDGNFQTNPSTDVNTSPLGSTLSGNYPVQNHKVDEDQQTEEIQEELKKPEEVDETVALSTAPTKKSLAKKKSTSTSLSRPYNRKAPLKPKASKNYVCCNCKTTTTSLWRKHHTGKSL